MYKHANHAEYRTCHKRHEVVCNCANDASNELTINVQNLNLLEAEMRAHGIQAITNNSPQNKYLCFIFSGLSVAMLP